MTAFHTTPLTNSYLYKYLFLFNLFEGGVPCVVLPVVLVLRFIFFR